MDRTLMEAAVLHAPGDLRYQSINKPLLTPERNVLVRVKAAGICGSDIGRVLDFGTYRFPTVPGHEFSGVITDKAPDVTGFDVNDRVAVAPLMPCFSCPSCNQGHYSLCNDYDFLGSRSDGGFAEYVSVPAQNVIRLPDNVSFQEAAMIEPAAIILHGVHKVAIGLKDAVVVIGCGALGYFAVQFARLAGAKVIAVDVDDKKLALAKQVGADICINARQTDAVKEVLQITQGEGAHYVLECAGNNVSRQSGLSMLRKQGTMLIYGSAHSEVAFPAANFEKILRHELNIVGSWNSYSVPFPGREWFEIVELLSEEKISMRHFISHRFSIRQAPDVFRRFKEKTMTDYNKILFEF